MPLSPLRAAAKKGIDIRNGAIPEWLRSQRHKDRVIPFVAVCRAVLVEFIGSTLFVFFACGSVVSVHTYGIATAAEALLAAIIQGFAIGSLVYAISHTSGGHINPAVSFALMVSGHFGLLRCLFYVMAQLIGAITGAALLLGVMSENIGGNLGATVPSGMISSGQAVLFEFLMTFTLIFTIFGTVINKRASSSGAVLLAPIPIGFSVVVGVGCAFNITGGSLNPARSFGPAVVSGEWTKHWIYWVGPLAAALAVGLLERYVLLRAVFKPINEALLPTANPTAQDKKEQKAQEDVPQSVSGDSAV